MKTAFVLLALAWVAISTAAPKGSEENSPKDAAEGFYRAYLKLNPRGLPSEEEMKTFGPMFSKELVEAISAARREQQKFVREHPDEKPPWCEGNLFASLYEGVSSFSLGAPALNDDKASFPVYLTYREGDHEVRWIDVIVLQRTGKEWRIWDIFLNAPWQFRSGPSLRAVLPGK
jgi:hypothetical protein